MWFCRTFARLQSLFHPQWEGRRITGEGILKTFKQLVWGLVLGEKTYANIFAAAKVHMLPLNKFCAVDLLPLCDRVYNAIMLVLCFSSGSRYLQSVTGASQSEQLRSWCLKVQNLECINTIKIVTPTEENSQVSYFHFNFNNILFQNENEKLETRK